MNWIVVQTKSNNEDRACSNLVRQGYEVFLPKIKKKKIIFNKLRRFYKPLFPGYIFVNLSNEQSYIKINNTFGVKKILMFGERICFLPIEIYSKIKFRCDNNDVCEVKNFCKGEKVSFLTSKNYFEGVFEEYIDEKRSFIFLEIMQRKIKTSVLNTSLEKI